MLKQTIANGAAILWIGTVAFPYTPLWCGDEVIMTIPLLEISNMRLGEAIKHTLMEYRNTNPGEKGYDGYLICIDQMRNTSISLSLKNVPLDIAIRAVANSVFLDPVEAAGNFLLIEDRQLGETHFAAKLTDEIVVNLGLERPITAERMVQVLRNKARIELHDKSEVLFDPGNNYVRIRMQQTEAYKLKALFELIDRGLKFVD